MSAFALYLLVIYRISSGRWIPVGVERLLAMPDLAIGPRELSGIILIGWYGFLSQLTIRWFLWLPIYLVVYPPAYVLTKLGAFAVRPLIGRAKQFGSPDLPAVGSSKRRGIKWKRIWMLLVFCWLLSLRTVLAAWNSWIPPLLLLPLWVWSLRLAYASATNPTTLANKILKACAQVVKSLETPSAKPADPKQAAMTEKFQGWLRGLVQAALRRYAPARAVLVIHRETLLLFTAALLLTFLMSSVFWGLIGFAIRQSYPNALNGYSFFAEWRHIEFFIWAFGCMTTSISFPGSAAAVPIKLLHALILMTGIFQISYLLACFSIMANAVTGGSAASALVLVKELGERLDAVGSARAAIDTSLVPPPLDTSGGEGPPETEEGHS